VGNGIWVRYEVRYGAFQGYVTVRYGGALRCVMAHVTARHDSALR